MFIAASPVDYATKLQKKGSLTTMGFRKKRKRDEEHENIERWLVSYADFITLLFAFFVTMYAVSRVDGKKLGSAVESLQRALGSVIAIQTPQRAPGVFPANMPQNVHIVPIHGGQPYPSQAEIQKFQKMAMEIQKKIEALNRSKGNNGNGNKGEIGLGDIAAGDKGRGIETGDAGMGNVAKGNLGRGSEGQVLAPDQIKFIIDKRGLVIRISDKLFFESGDASIKPDFIPLLNVLGTTFEKIPNHIKVEGHTDSIPINTARFPSNWELSTARATTIIRYLIANFKINPERISAAGYAEYRPVESNKTPEGRLLNRRVDFIVLSNREMEDEPEGLTTMIEQEKKKSTGQDPV